MTLFLIIAPICLAASADLDHSKWDALLKQYVNAEARVDYGNLKSRGLAELDSYLNEIAAPWPASMEPQATKAALINSYNVLTVRWIITNYPVESILKTKDPFTAERHTLNGGVTSLDKIEGRLRAMGDPRIHAALVCAGRSCPPLRREAYSAGRIDDQLDDNVRAWLANRQLNEFIPSQRLARISSIFKWYVGDFEAAGGATPFLARFAPAADSGFLREPSPKIEFLKYNWGLNDASDLGSGYSDKDLYFDIVRGALRNRWVLGLLAVLLVAGVLLFLRHRGARVLAGG